MLQFLVDSEKAKINPLAIIVGLMKVCMYMPRVPSDILCFFRHVSKQNPFRTNRGVPPIPKRKPGGDHPNDD